MCAGHSQSIFCKFPACSRCSMQPGQSAAKYADGKEGKGEQLSCPTCWYHSGENLCSITALFSWPTVTPGRLFCPPKWCTQFLQWTTPVKNLLLSVVSCPQEALRGCQGRREGKTQHLGCHPQSSVIYHNASCMAGDEWCRLSTPRSIGSSCNGKAATIMTSDTAWQRIWVLRCSPPLSDTVGPAGRLFSPGISLLSLEERRKPQ